MSKWIKHNGGPMPVSPDTRVDARFDDKSSTEEYTAINFTANYFDWCSVTEYRIIEEPMKTDIPTPSGLNTAEVNDDLRDRYAMAALTGFLTPDFADDGFEQLAKDCYKIADAMLAERGKR